MLYAQYREHFGKAWQLSRDSLCGLYQLHLYVLIFCLSVILGMVSLHMQGYNMQLKVRFVVTASLWQTILRFFL